MRRLALPALVLLAAGCGGGTRTEVVQPTLPRPLVDSWRGQADAVAAALAAGDGCTALARATALRRSVIQAIQARRVRPAFQETLLGTANDLVDRITCTPPAPTPTPAPPPAPTPHGHDHGHGKGHEKHGKHGKP